MDKQQTLPPSSAPSTTASGGGASVRDIDVGLLLDVDSESPQRIKKIVPGVVLFFIALFFIHFPEGKVEEPKKEEKKAVIKVLKVIPPPKIPPPEKKEEKKIRVAVPDPTPDEPEPIREPEPDLVYIPPGVDFEIGIPEGPPAPSGLLIAGQGTTIPQRIGGADPVYPEEAKRVSLEGVVYLQIVIDEHGNVVDVKVIQGAPLGMTEAAVAAVQKWKYQPATAFGRPVAVSHSISVKFTLK